jgi:dienelactone hydrolase
MSDHDLAGFERGTFTHEGVTRDVLRRGSGPAVIVMAEMPGISPRVLQFAERVAGIGCTAVLPVLFGTPGRDPNPGARSTAVAVAYGVTTILRACVSSEFVVWATGRTSPVVTWLRALAASEHERCGGPGVGAIGMCFTGGFALAMAVDERIVAPVLSQPSLPFAVTAAQRCTLDISASDLQAVRHRCANDGLRVVGLRFRGDAFVPAERFAFLREQLGEAFVAVELDDRHANPAAFMRPHSVLTEHLIDQPGQPTRAALDQVLEFFRSRLVEGPSTSERRA